MFNPGTFAMDDGGRCLLDVINDPLLLQSFLEDKDEESAKELGSLSSAALENALLGQQDQVSSTTSGLVPRQLPEEPMGYGCASADKPVAAALAVSATTSAAAASDAVAASPSPQLLVSSTTVPPAAASSNGLPGASPHSTRSSPAATAAASTAGSRPHSASPLPVTWSSPGPSPAARSQSLPSASTPSVPVTTKATATVAPLPVAPQQAPPSRPSVAQVVSGNPTPRTVGAPRLIQPKQPQLLPKLSSGSANMTSPAATATTRSQSPRAAQHKATPQPAPVPAPQPATTVQRGAAMGLNAGSPLLIGNPAAQQGMFPAGPAQGTFLLNQYIPGLGQSPILIQGALGQIQSSLGQIQGVQLALRPPQAGLALGPQAAHKPHGGHPGAPTPTLVIPQNLGPRPNIILAPRMVSSPLSFAIAPGQPLTLQQLQAMLPAQTMLAQPTLGAFQTDQHHQSLVQIPTFTQPQILAHDHHHHHHHHHHHGALSTPLISAGTNVVTTTPAPANIVTHHPTAVLQPAPTPPQPVAVPVTTPMVSAAVQQQQQQQPVPQAATTSAPAAAKPVKAPTVNLAELLKEHGIMPESTPPPSPPPSQESGTISVEVPITPAPAAVTENVQVVVSKAPQTVAVSPQQRVQLSLAHDGSVVLHPPPGSGLSSVPAAAPVPSPGLTVTPTSTSAPGGTALSRTHSALLERLSAAPPVSVPDLASLTAPPPRVSVSAPTMVAAPSLVAPSVMTHPHQLTLHTVNNGLVQTQQLGQPQSYVTLHGTAVANMLCHGSNNTRINHIVVSPSPSLGQQQHALHHTCHAAMPNAVVSSVASAVVPTTTTTAVMASSSGRTAVATSMPHTVMTSMPHTVVTSMPHTVMTSMPHTVVTSMPHTVVTSMPQHTVMTSMPQHTMVTVAACPPVTTMTVTPTVVVTSNSSGIMPHASGKCTAPMNSQNQQLYEQLQTQINYLASLKKPTMQQKLLLQQMLSIEEKLRESNKPQVSSSSNTTTTVPTSHAPHCTQRHDGPAKPTVISHPIPVAATVITAKPSPVTTMQVPTIAVATTTRTTTRTTHHKVNHADVKAKASILHAGNTASIVATPKAVTPHSQQGPLRVVAAASTTTSAACAASTCSSAPCSSASALSVPLVSTTPALSSSVPPVPSVPLSSSVPPVSGVPLVPSMPPLSTAPLTPSVPLVSAAPSASSMVPVTTTPLAASMPPVPTAPLVSNMPIVSCTPSMPTGSLVSGASGLSAGSLVSSASQISSALSAPVVPLLTMSSTPVSATSTASLVSSAPLTSTAPLVSTAPLASATPTVAYAPLVSTTPVASTISTAPLVSTAPSVSCAPLVSTTPVVSTAPIMVASTVDITVPPLASHPVVTVASHPVVTVASHPVVTVASHPVVTVASHPVVTVASHPVVTVASHVRVPNQAVSGKFVQQLHHAAHHHHHLHHHHHPQVAPVASGVSAVNQRSPPQTRPQPVVVRLQHPSNHIIATPSTTKQILVQVPSVINKPPPNKNSGGSSSSSAKSSVPVLPSKVEPIAPKPLPPPPEQPPAPPVPPPPKPVVVKPKVPDRVQRMHMFHQRLLEDQNGAIAPDTKNPFSSRRDMSQRLLRYHVYNSRLPREEDLQKTDELFADVSERLLEERQKLYQKFHYLMLLEGMRECSTAEQIMVEKLFLEHETEALADEKRAAEEGQYAGIEAPLPQVPESAWTFESSPLLPPPRPVKKEPPDSWLDDDDDRCELEPAAKRRSIKEEHHETDIMAAVAEEEPPPPPPLPPQMSMTPPPPPQPEHDDLVLSIHKELDMSPPSEDIGEEDDEFAHELADFEPPVARFPTSAEFKRPQQQQPPVVVAVPDWTCKSAEPRAPELDLSGIEGLDDDSGSGVVGDPLGRTHYFGDDDEDEDKDSVELHDQVQSAINSILDFRRGAADDGLCVDSKGAARGGPEPMDYDDATGDAQPDSVLDEAVRSILL
ncbi:hypothetical protein V5799_013004 [Amblyomma americanum]|uniref:GLTSCR protein conserved domain-containing protein n=1 Tax=Amblyomma americanum TaxID=6943 RepID=A0AAQ4E786_AMBAM